MDNIEIINKSIKEIDETIKILKEHLKNERMTNNLKTRTESKIISLIQTKSLLKLIRSNLDENENIL